MIKVDLLSPRNGKSYEYAFIMTYDNDKFYHSNRTFIRRSLGPKVRSVKMLMEDFLRE